MRVFCARYRCKHKQERKRTLDFGTNGDETTTVVCLCDAQTCGKALHISTILSDGLDQFPRRKDGWDRFYAICDNDFLSLYFCKCNYIRYNKHSYSSSECWIPHLALFWLARFNETTKYDQHVRAVYTKACRVRIYYSPSPSTPFMPLIITARRRRLNTLAHTFCVLGFLWMGLCGLDGCGVFYWHQTRNSLATACRLVELVVIERAILCVHV